MVFKTYVLNLKNGNKKYTPGSTEESKFFKIMKLSIFKFKIKNPKYRFEI